MSDIGSSWRPWQEIAAEAAREKDPEKRLKLTQELERALDERDEKLRTQRDEIGRNQSA